MLGRRLPKNRKFDYVPLYYDPKKEAREKKGIQFKRSYQLKKARAKQKSIIWMIVLLVFVLYLIHFFSKSGI